MCNYDAIYDKFHAVGLISTHRKYVQKSPVAWIVGYFQKVGDLSNQLSLSQRKAVDRALNMESDK